MKRSYITLIGVLLFLVLLMANWIFEISPENNLILGGSVVFFLVVFLIQRRKERRT
jgi:hypothetical protein